MITMIENITDKVVVALEVDTRPKIVPATAPVETKPAIKPAMTVGPKFGAPVTQPAAAREAPKTGTPAPPDEPVVRIRTPIFRTLS